MPNQPYFSIIIPTLNEQKFLPNLLSNLTKQTNQDFEVFVVDAKSKDKTIENALEFVNKLPSLTIIKSSQKNVSHQRNIGAKKAQGKIILFIDADTGLPKYYLDGLKYQINKKSR